MKLKDRLLNTSLLAGYTFLSAVIFSFVRNLYYDNVPPSSIEMAPTGDTQSYYLDYTRTDNNDASRIIKAYNKGDVEKVDHLTYYGLENSGYIAFTAFDAHCDTIEHKNYTEDFMKQITQLDPSKPILVSFMDHRVYENEDPNEAILNWHIRNAAYREVYDLYEGNVMCAFGVDGEIAKHAGQLFDAHFCDVVPQKVDFYIRGHGYGPSDTTSVYQPDTYHFQMTPETDLYFNEVPRIVEAFGRNPKQTRIVLGACNLDPSIAKDFEICFMEDPMKITYSHKSRHFFSGVVTQESGASVLLSAMRNVHDLKAVCNAYIDQAFVGSHLANKQPENTWQAFVKRQGHAELFERQLKTDLAIMY